MAPSTVKTLADIPQHNIPESFTACPTVGEFYANKSVFITGGTGFLGTVLIEAILSTSPDVGKIYVLVRDKYGSNANTRISRMMKKAVSFLINKKKLFLKLNHISYSNFSDLCFAFSRCNCKSCARHW